MRGLIRCAIAHYVRINIDMVETILQRDDALRLQKAATQMLVIGAQTIALEGQPLYADEEWGQFHQFAYAHVIPQLAQFLSAHNVPIGLDVLYDEFTTSNNPLNAEHFMGLTMQALGGVPINIPEEPAFDCLFPEQASHYRAALTPSAPCYYHLG